MNSELDRILLAKSIAIIGASNNPAKRGYQAIKKLLDDRYTGSIYPINPKTPEVLGLKAHASVLDVADDIDMALVCTPARTLPDVLADCGKKGIAGIVALATGFNEIGAEGETLTAACIEAARVNNVRIVGPNTNGVFNLHNRMNLVGVNDIEPGHIGIVSQSGNMLVAFTTEANRRSGLGFSTYVGVGNQLDIRFNEYLEYFGDDESTKVPVFYIEGFKNGRHFLDVCREVCQKKPVVIYKSGRTEAGRIAAVSHTGALAGRFNLTRDLLRQAGATVIEQSDKILSVAEGLSKLPTTFGDRVAILADGGGHATITTDALIENGLTLATFSGDARKRLKEVLPQSASLQNPIDVAGGTDNNPDLFAKCAQILLEDENIDNLMIVGMYGGYAERFNGELLNAEVETSERIGALAKRFGKPLIVQSVYNATQPEPIKVLKNSGIPVFVWPEPAVQCMAELVRYSKAKERIAASPLIEPSSPMDEATAIIENAHFEKRDSLYEYEAKDLLGTYSIAVPPYIVVRSHADLGKVCDELSANPMAMKIISQDILHKTDADCVRLKVSGAAALNANFEEILENAKLYDADARIEGVLVSPMAQSGVEVIIGVIHDPIFGPVMMFGLGGVYVEVFEDVSFRALPMSKADAREMVKDVQSYRILEGVRGNLPVDKAALEDLIIRVSTIALSHPEISEIDLNPVIVKSDGYDVVDARMILKATGEQPYAGQTDL